MAPASLTFECEACGTDFVAKPHLAGRQRRCSPRCGRGPYFVACEYCCTLFIADRLNRRQCGSAECKRLFNAHRQREFDATWIERYGEHYSAPYNRSDRARERTRRRQEELPARKRYAARYETHDALRRVRLEQQVVEAFAKTDVFERDGWTCQICAKPVDRKAAWPAPLSASLDHVVPLVAGGEHSMANTRCTHLACNLSKGAGTGS